MKIEVLEDKSPALVDKHIGCGLVSKTGKGINMKKCLMISY